MAQIRILNVVENAATSSDITPGIINGETVSRTLQKLMLKIKGEFMNNQGKTVDYSGLQNSNIFLQYVEECSKLVSVNLASLTEEEKMAFFINIYNALTIHGICEQGVPCSVLEVKNFWKSIAYNIGGMVFTLDDIEHGILRGNKPHPSSPRPLFHDSDQRLQYSVKKVDPRIHFALVCGAKSCPAINIYSATNLERGLKAATENFCSQEILVELKSKKVTLSKIFLWYKCDFGENEIDLLRWILAHVSGELSKNLQMLLTENNIKDITLVHSDYNWNLNNIAVARM